MHFTSAIFTSLLATAALAAPSPLAGSRSINKAPTRVVEQKREASYTAAVNPAKPSISFEQQCTYAEEYASIMVYNVVIADAKQYDSGGCGAGLLDNLHGNGCTITGWGCNYANDASGVPYLNANFNGDLGCDSGDVGSAIWHAFGHQDGIDCEDYSKYGDIDLPPVDTPPEKA